MIEIKNECDRKHEQYEYAREGVIYLHQDPDQVYIPNFAKELDVGLDLPVKINIDRALFQERGETPSKLRSPILYPDLKHYINIDGTKEDSVPWLEVPAVGWAEIPCGLSVKLPDDCWGLLQTRSSTIWKKHLIIISSTIDPGYTGQLGVLVYNPNNRPVRVYEYNPETKTGDRLGQLILIPRYDLKSIVLVDELPRTKRGSSGFGSSNKGGQK
jgi:dUTPase